MKKTKASSNSQKKRDCITSLGQVDIDQITLKTQVKSILYLFKLPKDKDSFVLFCAPVQRSFDGMILTGNWSLFIYEHVSMF